MRPAQPECPQPYIKDSKGIPLQIGDHVTFKMKGHPAFEAEIIRHPTEKVIYRDPQDNQCVGPDVLAQDVLTGRKYLFHKDWVTKIRPGTPPKNKVDTRVKQGPFVLYYLPKYQDLIADLLDAFKRAETDYRAAGFPLHGVITVKVMARAFNSLRSFYTEDEGGYIQLIPHNLKAPDAYETLIHEIAHFYHNHFVTGGFRNHAIQSRYNEVKSAQNTGGSQIEQFIDQMKAAEKAFDARIRKVFHPGFTYEKEDYAGFGPSSGKYTRQYRVVRWEGKKLLVEILNPSDWDRQIRPGMTTHYDTIGNPRVLAPLIPELQVMAIRQSAMIDEYNALVDSAKDDRYENLRSEWIPTNYAKTNYREWFAEVMTTAVLHPNVLSDQVWAWLRSVVVGGAAARVAYRFLRASR